MSEPRPLPMKTIIATISALAVIIGTSFTVDGRYAHAEETKKKAEADKAEIAQKLIAADREQKIEVYRLKIQFLNSKMKLTKDESDELEFTRRLVEKLQQERLK